MPPSPRDPGTGHATLRAAAAYFGIVFATGFALGMLRVPLLVARIGERWAELAEMPLMGVAIFLAAGYVLRRHGACVDARGRVLVGAGALALMLLAELLLAVVLAGRGIGDYLASRDPVSGTVYLGMLLLFAAMPWLRGRRRGGPAGDAAGGAGRAAQR